ncbi:spermidine synthase [Allosphingosinicella sp.]|jgi:spermidine synthase|uniref:spermidine synthase n=1 Tax=Allosphingosinicella sp. TaxID=2823234 RepID=UPI002EF29384
MIPRILVDSALMPDGGGEIRLLRRGDEYSIMLGATELMNSRLSGSEEALAQIACARIAGPSRPRVLIGGLGMGFTLRAALAALGEDSQVTVAELVPAVLAWARGPLSHIFGTSLSDPRVRIVEEDVAKPIAGAKVAWDAILLDVDNGPDALTRKANDRLYDRAGLHAARAALRPGGVLGIWSSAPDRAFTKRLRDSGFAVEEMSARARGGRSGARHNLWFASPRRL